MDLERVHPTVLARFGFRPRYRGLSISAGAIGALLVTSSLFGGLDSTSATWALITGLVGMVLGLAYFMSPAWRLSVEVSATSLAVLTRGSERFRLPWSEVKGVLAAASTHTCFVDGGEPSRSLLIPGPGATAPYQIDNREALYDLVLRHVDADRVTMVESIEKAAAAPDPDNQADTRDAEGPPT